MAAIPQLTDLSPRSVVATPLATHLVPHAVAPYRGALTAQVFNGASPELTALVASTGVYDLGYLGFLKITGADRIRWLNGMVTNTVQTLEESHSNYSFLLNAQGRILGDGTIYRFSDHLLFQTDRTEIVRLTAHLDHYIIMDEVELQELDGSTTVLGIAGPHSPALLRGLGLTIPEDDNFAISRLNGVDITIAHSFSPLVPRFELWLPVDALHTIWSALTSAGALPCGTEAIEALRILSAVPLYGVDIQERHLAQETAQARALNFNKGCYLGQEIVERIRSRATIHRMLGQFLLTGDVSAIEPGQTLALTSDQVERNPVGEITSLARIEVPAFTGTVALGLIRTEVLERGFPIQYSGGAVKPLDAPPQILQV